MRLRTTAPPNAFLMLKPNRFRASSLERTKTVKCELEKRFPARYTASKSPRRTSRASRGNVKPGAAGSPALLGCEPMTSLLATRRKHFAAALGLHACAEPVGLRAATAPRLKCTLWQSFPPYLVAAALRRWSGLPTSARAAGSPAQLALNLECEVLALRLPRRRARAFRAHSCTSPAGALRGSGQAWLRHSTNHPVVSISDSAAKRRWCVRTHQPAASAAPI